MISIDLRSHDGLMCPSCGRSVAALVDGMTPGASECVGCVADEMWPEMFATLRMLRDEIDTALASVAKDWPEFAKMDADALRRQGRGQVYAALAEYGALMSGLDARCIRLTREAMIRQLDPDFVLDIEARATGPAVENGGSWVEDGFSPVLTREFPVPDANPGTKRIVGVTDTVLTVESGPTDAVWHLDASATDAKPFVVSSGPMTNAEIAALVGLAKGITAHESPPIAAEESEGMGIAANAPVPTSGTTGRNFSGPQVVCCCCETAPIPLFGPPYCKPCGIRLGMEG